MPDVCLVSIVNLYHPHLSVIANYKSAELNPLYIFFSFNLYNKLWATYYYYFHFTDEETETQEILINSSKVTQLIKRQSWDLSPASVALYFGAECRPRGLGLTLPRVCLQGKLVYLPVGMEPIILSEFF